MIGDVWLILGGSSSIGRAFAEVVAAAGSDVILAGRDVADLERTAADVAIRTGRRADVLAFDAEAFDSHDEFATACFGDGARRLNVFVLFGVMPGQDEIDGAFELARRTVHVNYLGAVSILSRLAPHLEAQGGGRVVVLSSVAGDRGRPKNYVYGSAKAGLNAYLQGLRARLWRRGVTVTTVKAGYLDTDMSFGHPGMFLVASPEACAKACLNAAEKGREVIYFPRFWWVVMTIIKAIPERVFKRLDI
jgi:NAD(P)-dependent dehydrogenase (short-subunit alcohol dehydrogenase family)